MAGQIPQTDPVLAVLENDEWLTEVFNCDHPSAKAFCRWLTHDVLPKVTRGIPYEDNGRMDELMANLFIDVPELRPEKK